MTKRTRACDITKAVKDAVWERDGCCVICHSHSAEPNAHYISRAQGGLGIERNIVTLCARCHHEYDQTHLRVYYRGLIRKYLQTAYPDWDEQRLKYRKGVTT